jgi:hypothetical protein
MKAVAAMRKQFGGHATRADIRSGAEKDAAPPAGDDADAAPASGSSDESSQAAEGGSAGTSADHRE